jgi:hypothetical protein
MAGLELQVSALEQKCAAQSEALTALHALFCDMELSAGNNAEQFHAMQVELEVRTPTERCGRVVTSFACSSVANACGRVCWRSTH